MRLVKGHPLQSASHLDDLQRLKGLLQSLQMGHSFKKEDEILLRSPLPKIASLGNQMFNV